MYKEIQIKDLNLTISRLFHCYPVRVEVWFDNHLPNSCKLLQKVKMTGMDMFIHNNKENACENCSLRDVFRSDTFLIKPVFQDRKVIGVLLVASLDGQEKWLLANYSKLDESLNFCREWISNKVENERLRKNNHSMLEEVNGIFSFIQEPVLIVDPDGTIHNVSHQVGFELNSVKSVLMGENITEIFSQEEWQKIKNSQKQQEWKFSRTLQNGKQRDYTVKVKPVMANGTIISILIHLTPISEIRMNKVEQRVLYSFHDVKGTSDSIQNVIDIAKRVAPSNSTVLLRGESGTGKEVFAQSIHQSSNLKDGPFIALNCAAIPESLLESELFGHVKGAFTGATADKAGRFELANGGTIFLDEIGDLPFPLQVKLLRVVQERKIERVGDTKSLPVNVRIITATHRNLEELVANGEFREDLYYRLNVIPIRIPPLRERTVDIPILIDYFLTKFSKELQRSPKRISEEVFNKLITYSWPGNIRELQNVVHHFVQLEIGDLVTIESLPVYLRTTDNKEPSFDTTNFHTRKIKKQVDEKEIIIELLDKYGRDTTGKRKVADNLNISLPTLYRRITKYKIK